MLEGLKALREPCEVTVEIDSQYVKDGMSGWIHAWKRRNWKTVEGGAVKNRDLWLELDAAVSRHKLLWVWVKAMRSTRTTIAVTGSQRPRQEGSEKSGGVKSRGR